MAVLGGGVAGLTAAHELAERGFGVTVYERRALGGKARSFGVPGSGTGSREPLPAEHGMRFFPGFYQNLPDTMRRIPYGSDPNGTFGNLTSAPQLMLARSSGREDLILPVAFDASPWTVEALRRTLTASIETATRLPAHEAGWFVERLLVFLTSCDARRLGQWEHESWWRFTSADRFSEEYRRLLVDSVTRQILAAKASSASARTLGLLSEAFLYNIMGRSGTGTFDRLLNAPTNEAWIDPWEAHLRGLGVEFRIPYEVERLELREGRVQAAVVRSTAGREAVRADWFILAVPVERARVLFDSEVLARDPSLGRTSHLETGWMNGIQFYLREPAPIVRGHVLHIDSPWALSSLSQAQFWPARDFPRDYGDGSVRDCVSVDIGEFAEPGIRYGRPARELGPEQIADEVWAQLKAHLNDTGRDELTDGMLVSWQLDPGLVFDGPGGAQRNEDPLLINTPGSWDDRPPAETAIPNLLLASDYVRVGVDVACMEGANEAARRAVNALLEAAGSREEPVAVYDPFRPPEMEPLKRIDEQRWALGQPNALDLPPPP